jgi:transcription termination factor NusB
MIIYFYIRIKMSENLNFNLGFQKAGQSNYGLYDGAARSIMTPIQVQGFILRSYIANVYGEKVTSSQKIYQWSEEMIQMEAFRYMNTKFVAAALIIIDQYLQDVSLEDYENFFKVLKTVIFNDDKIMNVYLDNLIDKTLKKESLSYIEGFTKRILFNYIYKISQFRLNNKPSSGPSEYKQKDEISYPNVPGKMV